MEINDNTFTLKISVHNVFLVYVYAHARKNLKGTAEGTLYVVCETTYGHICETSLNNNQR